MNKHFIIEREGKNPLEFWGIRLAEFAWDYDYSDREEGISAVLYKTKGDKFVCQKIVRWDMVYNGTGTRTDWKQRLDTKVCGLYSEVVDFFGYGKAALIIYRDGGIPYSATEIID